MRLRRLLPVLLLAFVIVSSAGARSTASATLHWVGWDDKTGGWWQGTPDGLRDAHFRLALSAPGDTVTGLTLEPLKPDGTLATAHVWNTTPRDGRWILGVFRNGTDLNATDVHICDPVGQTATYDLYAEDDGKLATFQSFRVTVDLQKGGQVSGDAALGSTAGGPPAPSGSVPLPSAAAPSGNEPCASTTSGSSSGGGTTTTTPKPKPKPAKLGRLTLTVTSKTLAARACTTAKASYSTSVPKGASVWIEEHRPGKTALGVLKVGGAHITASVCSKAKGTFSLRATLRKAGKILVASPSVVVSWR